MYKVLCKMEQWMDAFYYDYAGHRYDTQRHYVYMSARADIFYAYMELGPPQEWLVRVLPRIRDCCRNRPSEVMKFKGCVYYLLSVHCKKNYIGETGHFQSRWGTHMDSIRGNPVQRVHKWVRHKEEWILIYNVTNADSRESG